MTRAKEIIYAGSCMVCCRWSRGTVFFICLFGIARALFRVLPAAADIYVYRDSKGVVHFTNVPTRPVYRPFALFRPYLRSLGGRETAAFDRLIAAACRRHGVEFALVKAVIKAESAFDPAALSPAGARGLMQLMPETAALHGVANVHAPRDNIDGGVRHLRLLLDRFQGNLPLTLAAYNAGPSAVVRYRGVPPYKETQEYVQRVLHYREAYRYSSTAGAQRTTSSHHR